MVHSNTKLIQPIIFETHVHRARGVVALFLHRDARPFFPLGAPARAPESRHGFERLFIRREHLHFRTLFTRLQILAPVRVRSALKTKTTQKGYPDHVASRPRNKRDIINTYDWTIGGFRYCLIFSIPSDLTATTRGTRQVARRRRESCFCVYRAISSYIHILRIRS